MHILIVDDEMSIRETFQVFLEDEGYEVSTAADFFEAESFLTLDLVSMIEQIGGVDVVVADIVLPRVNGLELLRRVRQINEDIPVVMITGEPDLSTAAEAVRLGAYDYISKPVTQEMLVRVVRRAVERKRLLDEKRRLEQENWAYQAELEQKVIERTAELAQRNQALSTLIDIGRDMSSTLDLEQVLQRISQRTAQVCGARRCVTLLLLQKGGPPRFVGQFDHSSQEMGVSPSVVEGGYQELIPRTPEFQQVMDRRIPLNLQVDQASPALRSRLEELGVASLLVVPLVSQGRVIGFMLLDHVEAGHVFASEQVDLAVGIAGQAAVAIENARLHGAAGRRLREMTALHETSLDIMAQLEMPLLLEAVIARAADLLDVTGGMVYLYDNDQEKLVVVVCYNLENDYTGLLLDPGEGVAGRVFLTGEPLAIGDYSNWPGRSSQYAHVVTRSVLSVPLRWQEEIIGVLNIVDNVHVDTFSDQDVQLLVHFADQAAIAITNARLFQEERRHASLLAVVSQVARQVVSILDLEQILHETAQAIKQKFRYSNVLLCLLDTSCDELVIRAMAGGFERLVKPNYRQSVGVGVMGKTAETGRTYLVNDVSKNLDYVAGYSDQVLTRSELCVPLTVGGKVIGVLDVQDAELNAFDQIDRMAMEMLADQIAVAIENARLYEAAKRHVEELSALHNIDVAITSILDSDEVLRVIYEQVKAVMAFTSFFIALYDEDKDEIHLSIVAEEGGVLAPVSYPCEERGGFSCWVARNREPLWVDDLEIEQEKLPAQSILIGAPTRSLMVLPLIVRDHVVGVISAQSKEPYAFTDEERRLFSGIAAQAAIVIHNAQLFEALNRRLAESRLLQDIVETAASTLDFDEVLARTVDTLYDALHTTLDITHLTFAVPDEREQQLRIHPSQIGEVQGDVLPLNKSVSGQVYQSGEPRLIPDVRELPYYFHSGLERGSELTVPVKAGGEVIAVLDVESPNLGAFDEDDLRLFSSIAAQLGVALEKTRLYHQLEEKTQELLHAYNELQETTRLRTELVQNVSHELRTPLSLIQGYTELLLEGELGPLSDKQAKALETVRARSANLSRLTYNLTTLQSVPRISL
ncbi:MAG TPA: GAF domain-containing protein, partial [Chloroflexi bacterium]|nr:GAF domain-containing protein [Chloroflexota bacterium]